MQIRQMKFSIQCLPSLKYILCEFNLQTCKIDIQLRETNRQRWQAPDVPAELAKRVICACIREICFFRFSMGPKSHKFSTSILTRHLYTRQLVSEQSEVINFRRQFCTRHLYTRQPVSEQSEGADFMTAQQRQGFQVKTILLFPVY